MAFQQPQQRPQQQCQPPLLLPNSDPQRQQPSVSPSRKRTIEESQEWILFSPNRDGDLQSRTSLTPRTTTHLTDSISLETHVHSQRFGSGEDPGDAPYQGTDADDDDAIELDSLDDGLHAFHHSFSSSSKHLDVSGGTLLPTHDGLGTFTSSAGVQEQLWQFERYNPHRRRHVRRKSSIQRRIDELEEEQVLSPEDERIARIEKWRLEQSRAVLDEIERETRRRQRRLSRMSGGSVTTEPYRPTTLETLQELSTQRHDSVVAEESTRPPSRHDSVPAQPPTESFWQRITRRVIQDLIGLDDSTLSVIFGEQLADETSQPTPTQLSPIAQQAAQESRVTFRDSRHDWEDKLLERIARELGVLVHQLSEHDGAFHAYARAVQDEPDYAGLPVTRPERQLPQSSRAQKRRLSTRDRTCNAPSEALFAPTMPQAPNTPTEAPDTSLWGIEEEPAQSAEVSAEQARLKQEQEYWERSIDVNMIFSYLRRRFSSTPTPTTEAQHPSSPSGPLPASWATGNTQSALGTSPESLRRAEIIKRQHPLVSRAAERAAQQTRRRESLLRRYHMQTLMQRRTTSSSCASQSTKRSRRSAGGAGAGGSLVSSRNYWDLGGSVGSVGSGQAMSSALGGWGEV